MDNELEQARAERRMQILRFSPECLASLQSGTYEVVQDSLPAGSQVVGAFFDHRAHAHSVVVCNPAFAPIPITQRLPVHEGAAVTRLAEFEEGERVLWEGKPATVAPRGGIAVIFDGDYDETIVDASALTRVEAAG